MIAFIIKQNNLDRQLFAANESKLLKIHHDRAISSETSDWSLSGMKGTDRGW